MLSRTRATTIAATVAAACIAATAAAGTASAGPKPADSGPDTTSSARAAGITQPGQAFMGWSAKAHGGPDAPAGTLFKTLDHRSLTAPQVATSGVEGVDVSGWQGNVNWSSLWNGGARFAYVKATEGTGFTNDYFSQQYSGSYNVGMIRGSYHFALPDKSTGATQANYFVAHGGGWSSDGKTLPGALDIEYNPYGASCFGLTQAQMRSWISSFTSRYKTLTGRDAVIYSTTDWWTSCTGNTTAFNQANPLWIARYQSTPGTLPGAWGYQTFWQYTSSPLDKDRFNGTQARLKSLALG